MAKRLRARMRKDGSTIEDPIWYYPLDPETGKHFEGNGDGRPGVGVQLRHVPPSEYRRIVQAHTARTVDADTKLWLEKVDNAAVGDAVCLAAVQDWYGIEAADGGPLPCTQATILAVLDIVARADVQYLATRALTPVTESERAASFRESARVGDVVESVREEYAVLSAGDGRGTSDGAV